MMKRSGLKTMLFNVAVISVWVVIALLFASAAAEMDDYETQNFETKEEAAAYLRTEFKDHEDVISITVPVGFQTDGEALALELFNMSVAHNGISDEGEYLKLQIQGWAIDYFIVETEGNSRASITYHVTYMTTFEQEQKVTEEIIKLFSELNIASLAGVEKVSAIYEYICDNVEYDYEHLEAEQYPGEYPLMYTAYGALMNKSAVCQGYAMLFYRLMLEAGVEVRLVSGAVDGVGHSWNIVDPENKNEYYHIDCTYGSTTDKVFYFLMGSDDVSDRSIDTDLSFYPISQTRYDVDQQELDFCFATEEEFQSGMNAAALTKKTDIFVQYIGQEYSIEYEHALIDTYLKNWFTVSGVPEYDVLGCYFWGYLEWDYVIVILAYNNQPEEENPYIYQTQEFTYRIENEEIEIGEYIGTATAVTIPSTINGYPVTVLGNKVFFNNQSIESVTISEGIKKIKDGEYDSVFYNGFVSCFGQCDALKQVVLPSTLELLGSYSFYECTHLNEITLNEGLKTIGNEVFAYCTELTDMVIPHSLSAFSIGCIKNSGIKSIHLPAELKEFYGSGSIEFKNVKVTVDENSQHYTVIDDVIYTKDLKYSVHYPYAKMDEEYYIPDGCIDFRSHENPYLRIVHVPATVEFIAHSPAYSFYYVDEDNPHLCSVDGVLFSKDMKTLISYPALKKNEAYRIPDGVERLQYAFWLQQYLKKVSVPESVTFIEMGFRESVIEEVVFENGSQLMHIEDAFRDCYNLRSVELPEGLEEMYYTFFNCQGLEYINIPSTVTWISDDAFFNTKLKIVKLPEHLQMLGYGAFNTGTLEYVCIPGEIELASLAAFQSETTIIGYEGGFAEKYAQDAGLKFLSIDTDVDISECKLSIVEGTLATCVKEGLAEGIICAECGEVIVESDIIPIDSWNHGLIVTDPAVAPTCTESGLSEGSHCADCNMTVVPQEVVEPIGHDFIFIESVDPTCTMPGYTEECYCLFCGEYFSRRETIPAIGHIRWCNVNECMYCGVFDPTLSVMHTEVVYVGDETGHYEYCRGCRYEWPKSSHWRLCNGDMCPNCEFAYDGDNISHGDLHYVIDEQWHQENCSICGYTSEKSEHIRFCYETNCYQCFMEYNGDNVAHGNIVIDAAVAPTCMEAGLTEGKYCSVCNEVLELQTVVPATGHKPTAGNGVPPTCTTPGWTAESKCEVCGEIIEAKEEIPALGHTPEVLAGKAASCTDDGLTEGTKCSVCGEILTAQEVIPAKGHEIVVNAAVEPTCTETGLTEGKYCSVCNEVLEPQTVVSAAGHKLTEGNGVPPTCTTPGWTAESKCGVCGETIEAKKEIPAFGHTPEVLAGRDATCTDDGLTEGAKCSTCGEILTAQEVIPAKGHETIVDEAVKPTCTETGLTEGIYCSVCGEVLEPQTVVPATGHKPTAGNGVPPTCTTPGWTAESKCEICGETIEAKDEIPALGHKTEIIEGKDATCTVDGLTEGEKCSVCGETLTAQEIIPAKGHVIVVNAAVKPTCTETGLTEGIYCFVCGEVLEPQTVVPATGHKPTAGNGVPPTCTTPGWTAESKCEICGETIEAKDEIPALGHKTEIIEGKDATCTVDGLTDGEKCSVCGEILTAQEITPALGHHEVVLSAIPATHITPGLSEGISCSRCGEILVSQVEIPAVDVIKTYLPIGMTFVGKYAFANTAVECVIISENCKRVEAYAFAGNEALKFVEIPASVEYIDSTAFADCAVDLIIVTASESHAHMFALEKGIAFVLIGE